MKKIIAYMVFIFLFFSYEGCGDFSIRNIDKPPPHSYEIWSMGHQNTLEVKKALLECGYATPFNFAEANKRVDINMYILSQRCMLKAGFAQNKYYQDALQNRCNKKYYNYSACDLPWDKIPDRSIKKRLESDYCQHKLYRTYPVCQP